MAKRSATEPLQCVAFLRAVNVGKRTVKGPELIKCFSKLGFTDVATFIASGNVIFKVANASKPLSKLRPELEASIEQQFQKDFSFTSEVMVRSMEEIRKLATSNHFELTDKQRDAFIVNIGFLKSRLAPKARKEFKALENDYDAFAFTPTEVLWLCRGPKLSDSPLFQKQQPANSADQPITFRKINTLDRIVAKFGN